MKAFYVMVLVLVAGAVPSHGRTESEGTVFNNTQPHESMNNVTVSSSKLVPYGDLYLVMQWPRSFCNSRSKNHQIPCYYQQVPGRFTVHGLWPQDPSTSLGVDCTSSDIYGQYPLFNNRPLDGRLVPDLHEYWPDLTTSVENNQCFWVSEYNKHGSCTFSDQNEYFEITLPMVKHLDVLISRLLSGIRGGPNIKPGKFFSPSAIKSAVKRVTSKMPSLRCNDVGNRIELLEIRFCVGRIDNGLILKDCNPYSGCQYQKVYLPRANEASSSLTWALIK